MNALDELVRLFVVLGRHDEVAPRGGSQFKADTRARAAAARAIDARARFDAAEKRFDEFRNRARLLATAVGVFIGLELTLLPRFIELRPATLVPLNATVVAFGIAVALLIVTLCSQSLLLRRLFERGYVSSQQQGLPNPIDVVATAEQLDEEQTHAAYARTYANAASAWEETNGELSKAVSALARRVAQSMWLVVGVVISLLVLVFCSLLEPRRRASEEVHDEQGAAIRRPGSGAAQDALPGADADRQGHRASRAGIVDAMKERRPSKDQPPGTVREPLSTPFPAPDPISKIEEGRRPPTRPANERSERDPPRNIE